MPQHVPRAVIVAPLFEATNAPRVAYVSIIPVTVGVVTVGTAAGVVNVASDEYTVPLALVAYPL